MQLGKSCLQDGMYVEQAGLQIGLFGKAQNSRKRNRSIKFKGQVLGNFEKIRNKIRIGKVVETEV